MNRRLLLTVSVGLLACVGYSHVVAEEKPVDQWNITKLLQIQQFQPVALEYKRECAARFPDMKPALDSTYERWRWRLITVSIQVNGAPYSDPGTVKASAKWIASFKDGFSTFSKDESRKRCSEYAYVLSSFDELIRLSDNIETRLTP